MPVEVVEAPPRVASPSPSRERRIQLFIRRSYTFLFLFLGGNIVASVLQAAIATGTWPSLADLTSTYPVQLALRHPLIFWPLAALLLVLAIVGPVADRRLSNLEQQEAREQMQATARSVVREEGMRILSADVIAHAQAAAAALIQEQVTAQQAGIATTAPFDLALLPRSATFTGRAAEQQQVLEALRTLRIAVIRGIGGIGKTTLAAEVAAILASERSYPDGIAVINCQNPPNGTAQAADLLRATLSRFGTVPPDATAGDLPTLAYRLLGGKHTLIILDNVEPTLMVGDLVRPLREAGATLLLTARQDPPASSVPPSAIIALEALPLPEARDLFRALFPLPATDPQIDAVVEALGRHTLAITLMAPYARDAHPDLAALASELGRNPRLAFGVHGDEPGRDLAPVFALSVDALPPTTQRLFALLGMGATNTMGRRAVLAWAEGLGIPAAEREEGIRLLGRRGLVTLNVDLTGEETSDRERVTLHPLLRAYAAGRFAALSETDRTTAHHSLITWYADYCNTAADAARSLDEANIQGALDLAITAGDDDATARICNGMRGYWRDRSRVVAGLHYLPLGAAAAQRIAAASHSRADRLRAADINIYYGHMLQATGKLQEAEAIYRQDLDVRRELGDRQGEGADLSTLGQIARDRGQLDAAEGYLQQALEIDREVQDRQGEGVELSTLGQIAQARGQLDAAEAYYRQGLSALLAAQDARNSAGVRVALAELLLAHQRGAPGEGCQLLAQAAAAYDAMGIPGGDRARELMREFGCAAG